MSRSNLFFLAVAVGAIAMAFWYRQQVFQEKPVPTTPKLAFVTGGSGPYWQLTAEGARAAAKSLDCELDVELPQDDESLDQQMTILTRLNLDKLDGVALSPLDAEGQTNMINRIQQQTNVVTFDSDAPHSMRRGHVGTSNYGAGGICARLVAEALPDGGDVLVLMANLTKENMIDRKSGFEETLNKPPAEGAEEKSTPQYNIVGFLIDTGDATISKQNIKVTLKSHPELACIVGMNSQHAAIIMDVLKEVDKLGKIKVVTFDAEPAALEGIEAGNIYATIAQDPYKYGFEATRMLSTLSRSGADELPIVGGGTVNINAEPIRQNELKEFKDRLLARTTKPEKPKDVKN
ncbi:substrate-binding domain-containing protein [Bythopirellula polymerisocia]|uniref:D-allose-binding periplasmic protein n=1 Tax=Bythopirellula polymerisocia TaxID=2528003 RepID=A0A5C6CT68_9BACT|nr:substrate-binding domain-containing protein [Bythopirellula polymerisocia]TWU27722.1 D-allose-binding periplasmic protein precursor [Bythopirellula polymerisocia]